MDVYEAIEKRRTVRKFTQGVSEDELRKLLMAGTKAPSGSNAQPWEFILVDDPKIITELADYKYRQTLKMALSDDPKVLEMFNGKTLPPSVDIPLSTTRALAQKNAYRNCTVLAICNKKEQKGQRKAWMDIENIASVWMCIESMALAATADGFGIVTSIFREEDKVAAEKLLGIPENRELATIMLIGVQGDIPGKREQTAGPDFSWFYRNRFGAHAEG
jgi:nitroreductase